MIEQHSVGITTSDLNSTVTKFNAEWIQDYSGRFPAKREIYKNNIEKFGLLESSERFWIYTDQENVRKSAGFWASRYSRIWKIVNCRTFLRALALEVSDTVKFDFGDFEGQLLVDNIKGTVAGTNFDVAQNSIGVTVELALESGETSESSAYWVSDASDSVTPDPLTALEELTYTFLRKRTYRGLESNQDIEHNLSRHNDVSRKTPSGGDGLIYNDTTKQYEPSPAAGGVGAHDLAYHSDVTYTPAPTTNNILVFNSSGQWVPAPKDSPSVLAMGWPISGS
jgi:hypothetical protein